MRSLRSSGLLASGRDLPATRAGRWPAPVSRPCAATDAGLLGATRRRPCTPDVEWHGSWSPRQDRESARLAELPVAQRLLLTSDGTLTTALATVVDEPIGVRMLGQHTSMLGDHDDELSVAAGEEVLDRRVLLYGAHSGAPLLYGASRIVLHRLPRLAREALAGGEAAIGLVLRVHRMETFRIPLSVGVKAASAAAASHIGPGLMCWRRYAINTGGRPLMVVDEQFPAAGFRSAP